MYEISYNMRHIPHTMPFLVFGFAGKIKVWLHFSNNAGSTESPRVGEWIKVLSGLCGLNLAYKISLT